MNPTAGLVTVPSESISAAMFGLDLRLGYQINNIFAVYASPHLSVGAVGRGAPTVPGTFVGTVMGEATFADRFFVGAGLGYGVLNNPPFGVAVEVRAGAYPLMRRSANGIRRQGLMLGVDFRPIFVENDTVMLFMGCIGYEAF